MSEISQDQHLLEWASQEIIALRRRNEVLEAQVHTMDLLGSFLQAEVRRGGQATGEDVVWRMQKRIEEIKGRSAAQAPNLAP